MTNEEALMLIKSTEVTVTLSGRSRPMLSFPFTLFPVIRLGPLHGLCSRYGAGRPWHDSALHGLSDLLRPCMDPNQRRLDEACSGRPDACR